MTARHLGIDVGGTKCLGVVIDADGALLTETREPTPRGGDALIDVLAAIVGDLESDAGAVEALGVGLPGLITLDGVLQSSPNVPDVIELDVAGRLADATRPADHGRQRRHVRRARRVDASAPGAASTTW